MKKIVLTPNPYRDEQQQRKGRVELRHERDGPCRALGAHYGQG